MSAVEPAQGGTEGNLRLYVLYGYATLAALVLGFGGWAIASSINSAVIAPASIVVETNVKKIQHKEGGIVDEIFVRDGDYVEAGTLLVRLDETLTRANLSIVTQQLHEVEARQARLEAERDSADDVIFPESLTEHEKKPNVAKTMRGEQILFDVRRKAYEAELAQSEERVVQLGEQIKGLLSQVESKESEIKLIKAQLEKYYILLRKGLIPTSRILELERGAVALEGQRGELVSQVAGTRAQVAEVLQQLAQAQQERMTGVVEQLRDAQSRYAELAEKKIAAEDQLRRNEIKAPQSGFVHQLTVHTVGGVVAPGDTIMQIVPQSDALLIEARIAPTDIDQIYPDQPAIVRFSAFDQRSTPEVRARVETISADVSLDTATQLPYYLVRLRLEEGEIAQLRGKPLVPGMPAEVFIETGERSAMSYFVKPLADQMTRVFREE
jgi:HlyD family secretion protein